MTLLAMTLCTVFPSWQSAFFLQKGYSVKTGWHYTVSNTCYVTFNILNLIIFFGLRRLQNSFIKGIVLNVQIVYMSSLCFSKENLGLTIRP